MCTFVLAAAAPLGEQLGVNQALGGMGAPSGRTPLRRRRRGLQRRRRECALGASAVVLDRSHVAVLDLQRRLLDLEGGWVDGNGLRDVLRLVDPHKEVRQLEHVIPQGDDDELGILRSLFDVVCDDGDVPEVQSGIDLIHEVQWCGLVVVQCKDQRKGGKRLLSAGEVCDLLPALLRRPHAEVDAFAERVEGVHELELCVAPKCDHLVHLLEFH
eukprot:CAMPEP_0170384264 /NCGR_PEP_ID=MMETSP0117_2-20130122/15907_1 /TAXON_ID=400756 /ORGANISM="Durinskia baltica, Strain CSIRO CS-38" /LENGTH=213 /DNA_ID=CAMNT_0010640005 /DNA_START=219 /DNA_END=860 /DNA_ORIENTATION=-